MIEEWKQEELGEVSQINPKTKIPEEFYYIDLDSVSGTTLTKKTLIKKADAPSRAQRLAKSEDIFYQTVRPYQKNNFLFTIKDDYKYVFSTGYAQIRTKLLSSFLFSKLQTQNFVNKVLSECTGTSYPAISSNDLSKIVIYYPAIDEQNKIGTLFKKLDKTITLHQRKIDQLNTLKKALLQKMLADGKHPKPILRFKGFTGNWEQRKLKEIGNATGGTSIESEFSNDGVYKVISIGSYSENSTYRDQGIRAVQSPKTLKRLLNKGDLTMILNDKTSSGNIIGRVLLIEKSKIYVYNQRTERIEVNTKKFDSQFMYSMLNASKVRNKIKKQSQGNTQIYVNWSTIANTEYKVPKIEEQQQVGIFFKKLDLLIALHQKKLNHLKSLKKSLLQTMFI